MRSIICKKIGTALVLAAAGLPLAALAATEAKVTITATIAEKLELSIDKSSVSFSGNNLQHDVVITTSHNTGDTTNITVTNDTGAGSTFNLVYEKNTLPVTVTFVGDNKAVFDNAHTMKHVLGGNENSKSTKLHLTAIPSATQMVGTYTGSLVIKINKA